MIPRRHAIALLLAPCVGRVGAADFDEATVSDDDGRVDIALTVVEFVPMAEHKTHIVASGRVNGTTIGFGIELGTESTRRERGESPASHRFRGPATFVSRGAASDRFVDLLAQRYGLDMSGLKMLPEVPFAVTGIDGDLTPMRLLSGPVHAKVVLHGEGQRSDGRYAEVLLNIAAEKGVIEFKEVDPAYRMAIVRALTQR